MRLAILISIAAALAGASAGCTPAVAPRGIGTRHAPRAPDAIDLSLRTTDGRVVEIADQQGAPVLLHLFATYDGASLANHRELSRFAREHMDTVVLAVAIQLDAPTFAAAFEESQTPPYSVTYDPSETIVRGVSELGPLEAVPTVIMIDAHGRECARQVGYASGRILETMHEIALSRGGIVSTPETEEVAAPEPEPEPEAPPPPPPPTPPGELGEGDVLIEP